MSGVIKRTQDELGKFVKKPPLTEKLLSKPPFRFLHDIITAVMKSNPGLLEGLYTEEEMLSENVKDRDGKIRYLEKILDCLSFALGGKPLAAKPSKIVSGQEAEKTNEFLQALAKIISKEIDTSEAVQKVLSGEKPGGFNKPGKSQAVSSSNRSSSKPRTRDSKTNKENKENDGSSRRSSLAGGSSRDRSNSNSRNRKDRSPSTGSSKDRGSNRPSPSNKESPNKDRRGSKLAQIYEDETQQSNRSSRSKDKRLEKQPSEEEINEQPKDKGFENYIASLANDNNDQDDAENGHDDTIKNHNDSRQTNGSYPLPGFEENGVDNNNDQHFDHRDQIESNALQNGYREQDNDSPSNARPTTTKSRPKLQNQNSRTGSGGASRPHTGYGKTRTTDGMTNGSDNVGVLGEGQASETPHHENKSPHKSPQRPERPGSAMRNPASARPRTGRLKTARPPSARRPAPRLKEKGEVQAAAEEQFIQTRPQTGKVANVILDGADDDDDADEFLIQEKPKDALELEMEPRPTSSTNLANTEELKEKGGEEHGALVQQILETQKELEEPKKKTIGGVEIERENGLNELSRRRERDATQREVDKLRASIQTLTRSANPLGKLMDFMQEDVDSMQRELDTWRSENRQLQLALKHEESLTQQSVEPLKAHLAELEAAVEEQLDKISTVKSNILKNEEKISRMIGSVGMSTK